MADTNIHQLPAVIDTGTGVDTFRMSTNAATLCREVVLKTVQKIQGKRYVPCTGWQAIAVAHGCVASARGVEAIDGGVRAIGEVRRMDTGQMIAEAEGFVGDDESMWAKRPMYARRAMAQTRAISRACRSAFAHVVIMIDKDLGTTPAEEMSLDDSPHVIGGGPIQPVEEIDRDLIRKDAINPETGEIKSQYRIDKEKECVKWVDASLQTFKLSGQTTDSLDGFWKANVKRIDWMEENMPAEHERLLTGFDAARDNAKQRAA